jgi:hypothetical protein
VKILLAWFPWRGHLQHFIGDGLMRPARALSPPGQVDLAISIQQGVRARFYDLPLVYVPLKFAGGVDVLHPLERIDFLSYTHGFL